MQQILTLIISDLCLEILYDQYISLAALFMFLYDYVFFFPFTIEYIFSPGPLLSSLYGDILI